MKLPKHILLITLFFCAVTVYAQEENVNSLCGQIEDKQLSIPSYKFVVVDKNEKAVENLKATGKLRIDEYVWTGTGILILDVWSDAYWKAVHHDISISVVWDSKAGMYISQKVPEVKLTYRRAHRFSRKKDCWDKVVLLSFDFYDTESNYAYYYFHFPNTKINKLSLPDAKDSIKLELKPDSKKL